MVAFHITDDLFAPQAVVNGPLLNYSFHNDDDDDDGKCQLTVCYCLCLELSISPFIWCAF